MYWRGWILAAALCAAPAAAEQASERPVQIERQSARFVVNADGSYVETRETARKVLKESALEAAKSVSIGYSTSIQDAEVVEAHTLKADGRKVPVPPGNFQLNSSSGRDGDSPFYSDHTTLTAVFPELEVGDTTVFAYRLTARQPMFDGHFSVIENFNPATYYGDVRIVVDAPAGLPALHEAWQMKQVALREKNGRRVVEWHWRNREPVDPETLRDSVFDPQRYPGYAWSSFADYAQIAQAYGARATAKAAPTARIRTLADEIAGNAGEPREVARSLYEWVSRNISYAGNCIGLGAVVPRDLDVVLDNRMGDCKDHATLLQALLAARGIDSTQALVNAGGSYALPRVPVASVVNHVINYLPELDLYLDATASTIPFGSLPASVAGKPVLLVDDHHDDARTPANLAGNDRQRLRTHLTVLADGSVQGQQWLELNGRLAIGAREQFRNMEASDAGKLVRRYFQAGAMSANGSIRHDDPKPMLEHFTLEADFDVARVLPPSGGLKIQPWFISFAPLLGVVAGQIGDEDQSAGETGCGGLLSEEEYVLEFPANMHVAALPEDFSIEQGRVAYAASYRQEGQRVHVKRTLNDRTPGPVCSPEYNAGYARTMRRILPDLRQQVVYLDTDADARAGNAGVQASPSP